MKLSLDKKYGVALAWHEVMFGEDSETAPFHILIPKMDYQRGSQ
jgi:hypothetical protein